MTAADVEARLRRLEMLVIEQPLGADLTRLILIMTGMSGQMQLFRHQLAGVESHLVTLTAQMSRLLARFPEAEQEEET